jgi:hypothetical protein
MMYGFPKNERDKTWRRERTWKMMIPEDRGQNPGDNRKRIRKETEETRND